MSDHSSSIPVATFEAEASMDHWEEFNHFIEAHASHYLGAGKQAYGLRLACEELFSNIIRHSTDGGSTSPVTLRLSVFVGGDAQQKSLMVQIRDSGPFFDPQLGLDRDIQAHLPAADRPIGGLGLFLVQQSVDRVDYAWIDQMNQYRLYVDF